MKNNPLCTTSWPSTMGTPGAGELDKTLLYKGQVCGTEGLDGTSNSMWVFGAPK